MESNDKLYKKMRGHVRVDVRIPISISRVSEAERQNMETKVYGYTETYSREISEQINVNLSDKLSRIEKKLDIIMNMLTLQQYGFHQLQETTVNLSGGGIGFVSEESFEEGDIVRIKMLLDEPVFVGILVFGEIIRVTKKDSQYEIGIKFIKINENHRDIIVRFVIYKQKQKINI
jgi:hypothetical protein